MIHHCKRCGVIWADDNEDDDAVYDAYDKLEVALDTFLRQLDLDHPAADRLTVWVDRYEEY